jgi:sigma-B regulation protein RsbU (phosphoserine phosphatase)
MPQFFRRMEIRSQLESLPGARRFVREFCQKDPCRRLAGEGLWQLELAVHETATNIIRHAYGNRTDQRILIEIEVLEERIMVQLNHWGKPFIQRESPPKPVVDGISECGFGLYLIEQCVDRVTYECNPDGRNIISLLKQLKDAVSG